jgi:hypothetical protein
MTFAPVGMGIAKSSSCGVVVLDAEGADTVRMVVVVATNVPDEATAVELGRRDVAATVLSKRDAVVLSAGSSPPPPPPTGHWKPPIGPSLTGAVGTGTGAFCPCEVVGLGLLMIEVAEPPGDRVVELPKAGGEMAVGSVDAVVGRAAVGSRGVRADVVLFVGPGIGAADGDRGEGVDVTGMEDGVWSWAFDVEADVATEDSTGVSVGVSLGVWVGVPTGVSIGVWLDVSVATADEIGAALLDEEGCAGSSAGDFSPLSWYTLRELIVQNASAKSSGLSRTYSSQVGALEAHDPSSQTAPAHAPQNVVEKTICCSLKIDAMSQAPANLAAGGPQAAGSGDSPSTPSGTSPRGKK